MPKSKQNAFMVFVSKRKNEMAKTGQTFASIQEAISYFGPEWAAMDVEERAPFVAIAKGQGHCQRVQRDSSSDIKSYAKILSSNEKMSSTQIETVMSNNDIPVLNATPAAAPPKRVESNLMFLKNVYYNDIAKKDEEEMAKIYSYIGDEPVGKVFVIFHATPYVFLYEESSYIPAEIAAVSFSIEKGIIDTYAILVDPGELPLGTRHYISVASSEYGIPIPEYSKECQDYEKIWNDFKSFMEKNSENGKMFIFGMPQNYVCNRTSLGWLAEKQGERCEYEFLSLPSALLILSRLGKTALAKHIQENYFYHKSNEQEPVVAQASAKNETKNVTKKKCQKLSEISVVDNLDKSFPLSDELVSNLDSLLDTSKVVSQINDMRARTVPSEIVYSSPEEYKRINNAANELLEKEKIIIESLSRAALNDDEETRDDHNGVAKSSSKFDPNSVPLSKIWKLFPPQSLKLSINSYDYQGRMELKLQKTTPREKKEMFMSIEQAEIFLNSLDLAFETGLACPHHRVNNDKVDKCPLNKVLRFALNIIDAISTLFITIPIEGAHFPFYDSKQNFEKHFNYLYEYNLPKGYKIEDFLDSTVDFKALNAKKGQN